MDDQQQARDGTPARRLTAVRRRLGVPAAAGRRDDALDPTLVEVVRVLMALGREVLRERNGGGSDADQAAALSPTATRGPAA